MTTTVASSFGNFTEEQLKTLKDGLKEMSDVYVIISSSNDTLKEQVNFLHEELGIPKNIIKKLARTYHKQNYESVVAENEEFELLYQGVIEQ